MTARAPDGRFSARRYQPQNPAHRRRRAAILEARRRAWAAAPSLAPVDAEPLGAWLARWGAAWEAETCRLLDHGPAGSPIPAGYPIRDEREK